jgi:hypothetical protein
VHLRTGVGGVTDVDDDDNDANFLSAPGAALPENGLVRLFISEINYKWQYKFMLSNCRVL